MSAVAAWDYLPPDFVVELVPGGPITLTDTDRQYPLATLNGLQMMGALLMASVIWQNVTRAQRELLLSAVAGFPIKPRADVKARLIARGLIDDTLTPTEAGRVLVQLRPSR